MVADFIYKGMYEVIMLRENCPYCNKHVNINDYDTIVIYSGKGMFRTKILCHGNCYLLSVKETNDVYKENRENDKEVIR